MVMDAEFRGAPGPPDTRYSLGSRRRDLAACGMLALVVLAAGPRLTVYHRATANEISVVRVDPDGRRSAVPLPRGFWDRATRLRAAQGRPPANVEAIEARIRRVMERRGLRASVPPGTRYEWTIRYSENTRQLDQVSTYVHPTSNDVR